jgi:hypothetical protein
MNTTHRIATGVLATLTLATAAPASATPWDPNARDPSIAIRPAHEPAMIAPAPIHPHDRPADVITNSTRHLPVDPSHGQAALGLLAASPVSAASSSTPTASANANRCSAVLRSLSPRERNYVVSIISLTYTQLAAAFGTNEVDVSARPIDSCQRTK